MASYSFQLNGRAVTAESWDPAQPLLYLLRDRFELHGSKFGCGLGQCGACTVLVNGSATRSCQLPISRAAGRGDHLGGARYIIENPVRARIVDSPRDYPFLGSARYTVDEMLDAVRWQP